MHEECACTIEGVARTEFPDTSSMQRAHPKILISSLGSILLRHVQGVHVYPCISPDIPAPVLKPLDHMLRMESMYAPIFNGCYALPLTFQNSEVSD